MIFFNCIAVAVITMTVTIYTPGQNKISGGMYTASGSLAEDGVSACGSQYKFGTYFEVIGDAKQQLEGLGIPYKTICKDRGGAVAKNNLDIALVSGDNRIKRAFDFGRKNTSVIVVENKCKK